MSRPSWKIVTNVIDKWGAVSNRITSITYVQKVADYYATQPNTEVYETIEQRYYGAGSNDANNAPA